MGPLTIDPAGRDQIRGHLPEGASIHVAHVARAQNPQAGLYADLEAFERDHFPEGAPQTIIDTPPEPWMAALTLPDLPIRWNSRTVEYLRYFRDDPRGQSLIRGWLKRMGRYEHVIRRILREVGVPEDLAFVAMAESAFDPTRRSRVGAAGMWQFMDGTGRVYGLHGDFWVDERRDIERSTYAAAAYLKDLRVRFGSWELALAAYNAGVGRVLTAVSRHNTNNFWALCEIESGLPHATTNYVPKIMAAAVVARNRAAFAVDERSLTLLPPVHWITVQVPEGTSLATIAKSLDVEPDLLYELNAHLIRKRLPPGDGFGAVKIPQSAQGRFQAESRRWRAEAASYTTHEVRYGETAGKIAGRYGISTRELRRLNELEDDGELQRGTVLLVPARHGRAASQVADKPLAAVPLVTPGPGERLVFFEATRATTPRGLSEAFSASWEQIVAWNDLDPQARIQPGQLLQMVVADDFSAERARVTVFERSEVELTIRGTRDHIEAALARRGLVRRAYKARRGDTLEKIGKKFGLSAGDLARINGFSRKHEPDKGELVIVYVESGKTRGTVKAPAPEPTTVTEAAPPAAPPAKPTKPTSTPTRSRGKKSSKRAPSTAGTSRLPGHGGEP
ncbi:MAG: LysM peptidoglycan-binding domain-containing protein [Nannocystaceae bacterium]